MEIRQEWVNVLINKGFSFAGATDTVKDLRALKSELSDSEFGQWLKTLSLKNILVSVGRYYKKIMEEVRQQGAR